MSARNYTNTATEASLTGAISSSDASFTLTSFSGFPTAPFTAAIERGTANEEIVLVTAVSVSTVSATRGYDGTTSKSHAAGVQFLHVVVAKDYAEANAHVNATTAVHGLGLGSAVVGTTDTQTLTNKTLTAPTVTAPTITGAATLASATLSGALTVAGATALAALTASGNASVTGTFAVAAATTLGALTAGTTTLADLVVTGNAAVTGAATAATSTTSGLTKGAGLESTAGVILAQIAAPTGVASKGTVYAKTDGGLYLKAGTGSETRVPVHWGSGTTYPSSPLTGDTFVHTTISSYMRWNGAAWRQVEPGEVSNAAARVAISTGHTSLLYPGFVVRQNDVAAYVEWTGTAWSKRPSVPTQLWSIDGLSMPGSGGVAPNTSSTGALNSQGPIPAHTPGAISVEIRGEVTIPTAPSNTAGLLWIALGSTSASPDLGAICPRWRMHFNSVTQLMTYTLTGLYASDGAAKWVWVMASNDPASAAAFSLSQGSAVAWQL